MSGAEGKRLCAPLCALMLLVPFKITGQIQIVFSLHVIDA